MLVVRVQDEQQVQCLGGDRIDCIGLAGHGEKHVQHVGAVTQVVARIDERLAESVLVSRRRDRRQFRDDPMGEDLAMAWIFYVGGVVIKSGHRGHHGRDHGHRVGIVMETLEKAQQLLVDHGVPHDGILKCVQFGLGRQGAVDQEICHFEEAGLFRELFDRITAIQENAGVAVDVGDFALATGGGHEAGVEGEHSLFLGQVRNVQYIGSDRSRDGVKLACLSCGEILEFVFRAHCAFPTRRMFHSFTTPQPCTVVHRNQGSRYSRAPLEHTDP